MFLPKHIVLPLPTLVTLSTSYHVSAMSHTLCVIQRAPCLRMCGLSYIAIDCITAKKHNTLKKLTIFFWNISCLEKHTIPFFRIMTIQEHEHEKLLRKPAKAFLLSYHNMTTQPAMALSFPISCLFSDKLHERLHSRRNPFIFMSG
jgi:hypothetical protein